MRTLKNDSERAFQLAATKNGWDVTKRGWPDFFCTRGGKIVCVEVKMKRSHNLKQSQAKVMRALASYGIPCFKWTPDAGFVPIRVARRAA